MLPPFSTALLPDNSLRASPLVSDLRPHSATRIWLQISWIRSVGVNNRPEPLFQAVTNPQLKTRGSKYPVRCLWAWAGFEGKSDVLSRLVHYIKLGRRPLLWGPNVLPQFVIISEKTSCAGEIQPFPTLGSEIAALLLCVVAVRTLGGGTLLMAVELNPSLEINSNSNNERQPL